MVGNNSYSSLRRPSYSLFIRASFANPLFLCSCPIGFCQSGKIRCPLAFLEVINCPNRLSWSVLESIYRTAREISSLVVGYRGQNAVTTVGVTKKSEREAMETAFNLTNAGIFILSRKNHCSFTWMNPGPFA